VGVENGAFRIIFVYMREEVTGGWRKTAKCGLNNLYPLPGITRCHWLGGGGLVNAVMNFHFS
jgi:hypothetical protein